MSALPKPAIDSVRWADVSGDNVEPNSGQKDSGWAVEQRPPAQFFNWWQNKSYQFFQYLDTIEQQLLAFTDNISFAKSITGLGSSLLGSAANSIIARLQMATAPTATLPYTHIATWGSVNVYAGASDGSNPSIAIAANAVLGSAGTWTKVVNSQTARIVLIGRDSILFGEMHAAQNTAWTDAYLDGAGSTSGWGKNNEWLEGSSSQFLQEIGNGRIRFKGTTGTGLADANPAATAIVLPNSIHAKNIAKAWGHITTNSTAAPAIDEGFNIATVVAANPTITVTLQTGMQSANYVVDCYCETINGGGGPVHSVGVKVQSATQFTIDVYSDTVASPSNKTNLNTLGTTGLVIGFVVYARQDS